MTVPQKNWFEWTVFAGSAVLVLAAIGSLIEDAITDDQSPPRIEIQLGDAEPQSGRYVLPVTVTNHGDQSAEDVHIQVTLELAKGDAETADFEIPYVPRHATRSAWVTFQHNPANAKQLTARPMAYNQP